MGKFHIASKKEKLTMLAIFWGHVRFPPPPTATELQMLALYSFHNLTLTFRLTSVLVQAFTLDYLMM